MVQEERGGALKKSYFSFFSVAGVLRDGRRARVLDWNRARKIVVLLGISLGGGK